MVPWIRQGYRTLPLNIIIIQTLRFYSLFLQHIRNSGASSMLPLNTSLQFLDQNIFFKARLRGYLKISLALYLGPNTSLSAVYDQAQVIAFLDTKKKDLAVDRDQKWIVIWNSYLVRIRHFCRWLCSHRHREPIPQEEWETPHLVKIRDKKTKRQSPSPYDVAQI
jgi:hypothetical protein